MRGDMLGNLYGTLRSGRSWIRPLVGAAILAMLFWRLGAGPFVDAVRRIDGWSLAAATAISALTTVCCAWRWTLVARRLGVALRLPAAVAECYRSQFLNVTLPGGVVGDVHRGLRHGRGAGDVGRALRAIAWERSAGQVVLVVAVVCALAWVPASVRLPVGVVGTASAMLALAATFAVVATRRSGPTPLARVARATLADLRAVALRRRTVLGVVAASGVALVGNVATFVIAARSAGSAASPEQLLPLALLVLLAMALPLNLAGWGPREGAAAWAFGAAGLGVDRGVAVAVVYGVLVLVASLPGAGLLLMARSGRHVGAAVPEGTDGPDSAAQPTAHPADVAHA